MSDNEIRIDDAFVVSMFRRKADVAPFYLLGFALALFSAQLLRNAWVAMPAFVVAAFVSMALMFALTFQRKSRATLRADRSGIRIGDLLLPRATIRNAYRLSNPTRIVLERTTFAREYEITLLDADADRILRATELDPMHKVMSVPIGSYVLAKVQLPLGLLSVVAMFGAQLVHHGSFAIVGLCMTFLSAASIPGRAEIGADGILLRWLAFRRFIRARDIAGVVPTRGISAGVRIQFDDGRSTFVPMEETTAVDMATLMQRTSSSDTTCIEQALLARANEGARAWIESIRRLTGSASFRDGAVEPERLWQVLENPTASPAARVAAAIALAPTLDARGRMRLRAAEEATASPRLRIAFEAAANDVGNGELEAAFLDAASE